MPTTSEQARQDELLLSPPSAPADPLRDPLRDEAAPDTAAHRPAGPAQPLPFLARLQAAFGEHDLRGAEAYVGGGAAETADELGATAYAAGETAGFAAPPDLHTAAHEAAHIVQQRQGVRQETPEHEAHADRVADAVVRGEDAQPLLGAPAPPSAAPRAVQRRARKGAGLKPEESRKIRGDAYVKQKGDRRTVDVDDIHQASSNCWVLGTMLSVAHARPELLEKMITRDGAERFKVGLGSGAVSVDRSLPGEVTEKETIASKLTALNHGLTRLRGKNDPQSRTERRGLQARSRALQQKLAALQAQPDSAFSVSMTGVDPDGDGVNELWPALIEKAMATRLGGGDVGRGYADIAEGGASSEAFQLLLGRGSRRLKPGDPATVEQLQLAYKNRWPVTITTVPQASKTESYLAKGLRILKRAPSPDEEQKYAADRMSLCLNHVYALKSIRGERVSLLNPHGRDGDVGPIHFGVLRELVQYIDVIPMP